MVTLTRSRVEIDSPYQTKSDSRGKDFYSSGHEIIILISAPLIREDEQTPVEALSVQKEIEDVLASLENSALPVNLTVTVKFATLDSLFEVITKARQSLILHFIGHGMPVDNEIALMLEDEWGLARPFSASELQSLLKDRPYPPCQLALLNACHSQGMAEALTENGVSHVVAVNTEDVILDGAASCFAKQLYRSLFNAHSIQNAFKDSRLAVEQNDRLRGEYSRKTFKKGVGFEEAFKYHLLPGSGVVHRQSLLFKSVSGGSLIRPRWQNTNLEIDDPSFFGRSQEIYQINRYLSDHRCVALHGMGGMGKTALGKAVGRWQQERSRWQDGVWWVDLRNVPTVGQARMKIAETLSLNSEIYSNELLKRSLNDSNRLLILDDLDKLIQQDRSGLIDLLKALSFSPRIKLLLTSREDIPPEVDHQRYEVQEMTKIDAMRAFYFYAPPEEQWQREENSAANFEVLMAFLDGYPMPIRLAGAYLKEDRLSNLNRLCERLNIDPNKVLRPRKDKESRENSLRAALDLSYQALAPDVQDIFSFLALFPDGLTEDLMRFVLEEDAQEALITLLQFSMAELKTKDNSRKFTLPEPARDYAKTKQQIDWIERFGNKILEYYDDFVEKAFNEEDNIKQKQRLQSEQTNLRQFLMWGYAQERRQDCVSYSARITVKLAPFWQWIMPGEDVLNSLEKAVKVARKNRDNLALAQGYQTIGDIRGTNERLDVAIASYRQAIEAYQALIKEIEDKLEKGKIYEEIGNIAHKCADLERAEEFYLQAKAIYLIEKTQDNVNRVEKQIRNLNFFKYPLFIEFSSPKVNQLGEIIQTNHYEVQYYTEYLPNDLELEMAAIPGGSFWMGTDDKEIEQLCQKYGTDWFKNEQPKHFVTVQPFLMGKYAITQAQWGAIASRTDLQVARDLDPNPAYFNIRKDSDRHPLEQVSWYDAIEFCGRLSKLTRRDYRLPSEAEWEYACRAGTTTPFHFGDTLTDKLANYDAKYIYAKEPKGEYRYRTIPVGQFSPNPFGLYDMHGNTWEWCTDHWHKNYNNAPRNGSAWLNKNDNQYRMLRGGSWDFDPRSCRSAVRVGYNPVDRNNYIGFRVVCCFPRT